jgi:hypothetical protein
MAEEKKTRKPVMKLTRLKQRALEDMVVTHREQIEAGQWTQRTFADKANLTLRCGLGANHVAGAARVMGIVFPKTGPRESSHKGMKTRMLALELALETVIRQLDLTANGSLDVLQDFSDLATPDVVDGPEPGVEDPSEGES